MVETSCHYHRKCFSENPDTHKKDLKPTMSSSHSYMNEVVRLQTFRNWPVAHIVSPENLAKAGFYSLNQDDKTKCAYCKGIVDNWESGDDPDREHRRHFPYCPFVRNVIQPRLQRLDENMGPNVNFDTTNQRELGIYVHSSPYQKDYVTVESRIRTFSEWPKNLFQTPSTLADAGFYYLGYDDAVQCFSCGGGFKEWNPEDDPWMEHAKSFPKCNHVLLVKGRKFVEECGKTNAKTTNEGKETQTEPAVASSNSNNTSCESQILSENSNSNRETKIEQNKSEARKSMKSDDSNPDLEVVNKFKSSESSTLCKICLDKEVGVVFLPCGHLAVCVYCAPGIKICPICRSQIKGTVRTFLS